jgi:hypothetical protein
MAEQGRLPRSPSEPGRPSGVLCRMARINPARWKSQARPVRPIHQKRGRISQAHTTRKQVGTGQRSVPRREPTSPDAALLEHDPSGTTGITHQQLPPLPNAASTT